jgi:Cof subfamily protein (haloacid dehalogenase superfamily)
MAPRYRLLVSDIDGTLVAEDKVVSPLVIDAVRRAQGRGVKVCLATGRMWDAARPFVEAIRADSPIILYNGALVYDFASGRTISVRRLPRETARRALEAARRFPVSPTLFTRGTVFAERMTPHVALYARRDGVRVRLVPSFDDMLTEDPSKILIVAEPPDLQALSRVLASLPETPVNQVFSQPDYLEVIPPDTSKGDALALLAAAAGVPLACVVAIGDNMNDLTMLQVAGLGIAVEGSPAPLQAAARAICPSPERDGVRDVIERLFLRDDAMPASQDGATPLPPASRR